MMVVGMLGAGEELALPALMRGRGMLRHTEEKEEDASQRGYIGALWRGGGAIVGRRCRDASACRVRVRACFSGVGEAMLGKVKMAVWKREGTGLVRRHLTAALRFACVCAVALGVMLVSALALTGTAYTERIQAEKARPVVAEENGQQAEEGQPVVAEDERQAEEAQAVVMEGKRAEEALLGVTEGEQVEEGLPLVRLQVVAEDDSEEAQRIKRALRDVCLRCAEVCLGDAADDGEAYRRLLDHAADFQTACEARARELGYGGEVRAEVGVYAFPDRIYGGVLVPAGEYRALRVTIGAGEGHNWWCVLYPTLCIVNEEDAVGDVGLCGQVLAWLAARIGGTA